MVPKIVPLSIAWFTVFLGRAHCPSLVHVSAVEVDDILRIGSDMALHCIQAEMPQVFRGDVERQAAFEGFGGRSFGSREG